MIELLDGKLVQWDTGRYVRVAASDGDGIDEVHCYGENDTTALNVEIKHENGVILAPIPNILLQKNQKIFVCAVKASGDSRRTVEIKILSVSYRVKPEDYVYTETEVKSYEALEKRIEALEESGGVSDEQIAEAVDKYMSENPIDIPTDYVKSVNGKTPDKKGNVEIEVGGGATPRIEISDSVATLEPNKFYVFPEMSTLTIVFGGTVSNEIVKEYKFRFISGATATTLILPQTVNGDITINANSVVEVSIIDGYAVSQSWAVS